MRLARPRYGRFFGKPMKQSPFPGGHAGRCFWRFAGFFNPASARKDIQTRRIRFMRKDFAATPLPSAIAWIAAISCFHRSALFARLCHRASCGRWQFFPPYICVSFAGENPSHFRLVPSILFPRSFFDLFPRRGKSGLLRPRFHPLFTFHFCRDWRGTNFFCAS